MEKEKKKDKRVVALSKKDIKHFRKVISDCRGLNEKLIELQSIHIKLYDLIDILLDHHEKSRELLKMVKLKDLE